MSELQRDDKNGYTAKTHKIWKMVKREKFLPTLCKQNNQKWFIKLKELTEGMEYCQIKCECINNCLYSTIKTQHPAKMVTEQEQTLPQ
jgi:hypothetical protein